MDIIKGEDGDTITFSKQDLYDYKVLSRVIISWLSAFRENAGSSYPMPLLKNVPMVEHQDDGYCWIGPSDEDDARALQEWLDILDSMIRGFEATLEPDMCILDDCAELFPCPHEKARSKLIDDGLLNFASFYEFLWD